MIKNIGFIVGLLCLLPIGVQSQSKWFVSESGGGTKDGTSWVNAADNLQETINKAQAEDTVWVAEGIYSGGFIMKDGVQVFGGFSGTESNLEERSLPGSGEHLSILDGNGRFRVLTQETPFEQSTVWDGFILQNGQSSEGAGAYLNNNGVLRRCVIRNNKGFPGIAEYDATQGGVVVDVDIRTHRVTVLAADDYGANYAIGIAGRGPKNEFEDAVSDMDGNFNSLALQSSRAYQVLQKYTFGGVDGWYIPSAGEWAQLLCDTAMNKNYSLLEKVDEALRAEGKEALSGSYWSSTMAERNGLVSAWYADFDTKDLNVQNVWQYKKVRGMRVYTFGNDTGKGGAVFALNGSKIEGCLIYDNQSALGYAVCARGNVDIIASTLVANYSDSRKINSSVIDGGNGVRVYNTIVVDNVNRTSTEANYSAVLDYQYSAIGTAMQLPIGNVQVANGADEFVDGDADNYVLKTSSVGAWTGNASLLPRDLDTDLAGVSRVTDDGKTSMGAFEPSDASRLNDPLDSYQVSVYPSLLRAGEWVQVDIFSSRSDKMQLTVALYDVLGMCYTMFEAQTVNKVRLPEQPGMYVLKICDGNNLYKDYKLIVH